MSSVYLWVIKNALCLEMASERPFISDQKELLQSSPLTKNVRLKTFCNSNHRWLTSSNQSGTGKIAKKALINV